MTPHNLPRQATPFIGRANELAEITRLLADPTCQLLTLTGPGGIGKTRLALQAAEQQVGTFAQGVSFVSLAPLGAPESIVPAIVEAGQFQLYSGDEPKQQLINYLREKSMLLLLDNFEHLLGGAALLAEILSTASGVRMLVTSRERLNLVEEWALAVEGLPYPTREDDLDIETYSAVQLFLQNARRAQVDFMVTDANRPAMTRICRLVGGMPLGIELAAAWVRALPCEQIADEIERGLDILESPARNVEPRHRNMRAAFEPTWRRLSEEDRSVFKNLSVFRGTFTPDAASYVAGASLRTLSGLVDKSLVHADARGRYEIHELMRQYAEEQLDVSADEHAHAHDRHCAYYAEYMHQRWQDLRGSKQKEALEEIEAGIGNVVAGWHWAVQHKMEKEIEKSLDSLWFFYDTRSRYHEGEHVFGMAAEALAVYEPDKAPSLTLGKLVAAQGMLQHSLSLPKKARTLLEYSLAIFRQHDVRTEIAHVLFRLGEVALFLENDYPLAKQHLRESLALYQETGDQQGEAFALAWLGFAAYSLGDFSEAKRLGQEGLALCDGLGSRLEKAMVLIVLSCSAYELQEYSEAKRFGQESVTIGKEIGIYYATVHALILLGAATCTLREYSDSRRYLFEALKMAHETSFMPHTMGALVEIANLLAELGNKERALALLALPLHHSAHYELGKQTMHRLLTKLEAELPRDVFSAALGRGKTLNLNATVQALLVELSQSVQEIPTSLPRPSAPSGPDSLTQRELEILRLIADGLSNAEIAQKLFLSAGTVKVHTHNIYGKLSANSRTQAVAQAQKLSLL